ncbi:hypothetical protein [Halapricum sp. CBA1109]|uniref:hypothetical protein n=1 Tax=Halapricum sp. CBA1109 TaxID=2668068 RepID=UPI0012FBE62E|nr:hypothetical protein [Halapricum sp. CBA1109]
MPAPAEYKDTESLTFGYSNPRKIAENEDNFDEDTYETYEQQELGNTGVDFDEMTLRLGTGEYAVVDGDYEEDDVVDELESDGEETSEFEEDGEEGEFTVYVPVDSGDTVSLAFAVNGTRVVRGTNLSSGGFGGTPTSDADAVDVLETVIDTQAGNTARFTDESEAFSILTDELGETTLVSGRFESEAIEDGNPEAGSFEGALGGGVAITVNGEQSDAKFVTVFENEGDADQGDLEDYVDESLDDRYDPNGEPAYDTGGRTGVIEFTFDTDER